MNAVIDSDISAHTLFYYHETDSQFLSTVNEICDKATKKTIPLGQRLNMIYEGVSELFSKYSPESIAVEKIFSNKNPQSTLKLGKARAIIFLVAAQFKVDIFEYSPNTVKKNLVGYGHAEKVQIIKMIERFFPGLKSLDHDSADALAVAICHSMQKKSKINLFV